MLSNLLVSDILNEALRTGGDFAELFLEDKRSTSIRMLNGVVDDSMSGRDFGIGIRLLRGHQAVYGYTNDIRPDRLRQTARNVAEALDFSDPTQPVEFVPTVLESQHPVELDPALAAIKEKVAEMRRAHEAADSFHGLVSQVIVRYLDGRQSVLIANSEGLWVEDTRTHTRVAIQAVAAQNGEKQSGFVGPGRHMGLELFAKIDVAEYAREAARMAVTMVQAPYAPSGRFPVVIANGFGGVIFHEACGHSLEATSVAKGTSVFAGKLGEQIAAGLITAVDDGTLPNGWGSANIDDEGIRTQRNVLIKDGVLQGYMVDRLNGRRMGMEPTGSGRRQSYRFAPTSRMTNTFICSGASTPESIIGSTEQGIYAKHLGGGSVNPATGEFNFAVTEGYMIEGGRVTTPIRGATLIGRGAEVLRAVDMVGNDCELGQGMCGSVSGSIPADVGQPTIRVKELTVGGRKEAE